MAKDELGPKRPNWSTKEKNKPALAVALDYKGPDGRTSSSRAPRVSASGRGAIAEQIIALAFEKGIPVREDADLAEILATVDVDTEIPVDALAAVAEILSYLYRYNRATAEQDDASKTTAAGQDSTRAGRDAAGPDTPPSARPPASR